MADPLTAPIPVASPAAPSMIPNATGAADPLAELRDLHLPETVGLWPPAPGWWLLVIVIIVAVGLLSRWWLKSRRADRYRRQALVELRRYQRELDGHGDGPLFLQQVSQLLRRAALAAFPRQQVAGLQGDAWLQFLDDSSGLTDFSTGKGRILISGPYQPTPDVDTAALNALAREWLRRHRRSLWEQALATPSQGRSERNYSQQKGPEQKEPEVNYAQH